MSTGAGRYDDLATVARENARALGVILIIIEGNKGNGFSVQAPLHVIHQLPGMLRSVADQIEQDAKAQLT